MDPLDAAHDSLSHVIKDIEADTDCIATEEDTKLKIITRILTEVLGWQHSNIGTERKHSTGYSDTFSPTMMFTIYC